MARVTHPTQIDLRFSDPAREFLDFGTSVGPGDFVRERFHLFRERNDDGVREVAMKSRRRICSLDRYAS